MGKRDVSFDEGLPVALEVRAPDGSRRPAVGLTVTRLNDHHCYLDVAPGAHVDAGDLLRFGVSHPCTVFDKWRAVPVVEDDDTVSDVLHTYF
jgi:D-serine deaminase-like pyridoxal phosphate-dependent protein